MSQKNEIALVIPANVSTKITDAIQELNADLKPLLVKLTADQRHLIPKMGDGTVAFVSKTALYAKTNPEFIPAFMNVEDMNIDLEAIQTLLPMAKELEHILAMLEDTLMLCGSEAFIAALMYYQSVKSAAKNNIPDAEGICNDLGERFPKRPKKDDGNTTPNQ